MRRSLFILVRTSGMSVSTGLFCSLVGLFVRSLLTLVHSYLRFSQQQLAPFVEANPGYLVDLERAYRVLSVDHEAPKAHPGIFLHIFF